MEKKWSWFVFLLLLWLVEQAELQSGGNSNLSFFSWADAQTTVTTTLSVWLKYWTQQDSFFHNAQTHHRLWFALMVRNTNNSLILLSLIVLIFSCSSIVSDFNVWKILLQLTWQSRDWTTFLNQYDTQWHCKHGHCDLTSSSEIIFSKMASGAGKYSWKITLVGFSWVIITDYQY